MIDFWQQSAAELQLPPATVACVVRAAAQYELPPGLVLSVMKVEGGVDGAVHRNSNGSYDYGLMQINSVWLPKLATMGITRDHLVHRTCDNVSVAAWIMRQNLDASDHFWKGVGNYHSRNARANQDYQRKIASAARQLPETWQWWNPKGWSMKNLVALLPWKNRAGQPGDTGPTPDGTVTAMLDAPTASADLASAPVGASIPVTSLRTTIAPVVPGAATPIPASATTVRPPDRSALQAVVFTEHPPVPATASAHPRLAWRHGPWSNPLAWGLFEGQTLTLGALASAGTP